ncbi:hypothetical protein [Arthrobacter sp. Ld5]|uniref:hypothetical protein n=1 Tax=Arthrobacter sp. Ld5 TaxID=649152 RepID=UPI003EB95E09
MYRINALAALALATTLSLVGCSSDPTSDDAPTTVSSTVPSATAENAPETYELGQSFTATTSYGATLTVEIPAAGPPEIEQLRTDLKIDPVSYAKVGIDNRQGTEDVSVYLVTVYDKDGTAYEFQDLSVYHVADWGPNYTDALGGVEGQYGYTLADGTILEEDVGDDLSGKSTDLHNQYLNGTNASKLEVSTGWLASTTTELPERITGITIQPNGLSEEVAMEPGGTMPSVKAPPVPTASPPAPPALPTSSPSQPTPTEKSATDTSSAEKFTYEEALAALNNGMPYYEAFCLRYEPSTDAGRSQCEGIEAGTVDPITGEYLGG